jgi:hypothetical protein
MITTEVCVWMKGRKAKQVIASLQHGLNRGDVAVIYLCGLGAGGRLMQVVSVKFRTFEKSWAGRRKVWLNKNECGRG